jgi:energy-coupling factor transporter ATP-binding protein EcfA2
MKIEQVKIKQFKCHTDLEVDLSGKNVLLVGENGVGKSSFIQFIEIALGNAKSVPPLAEGSGHVVATKDGRKFVFKARIADGVSKLTVETSDGLKSSVKGVIADITGAMGFDIDAFVEMSKKESGRQEQIRIFKSFLPKEVQDKISSLKKECDLLCKEREDVGRLGKHVNGAVEVMTGCLPCDEPESTEKLSAALSSIVERNSQIRNALTLRESLEKQLSEINNKLADLKQYDAGDIKSTESIEEEIKNADINRKKYNDYQNFLAKEKECKELREKYADLTAKIQQKRTEMSDVVVNCESPVEGLAITDDGLFYHGKLVDANTMSTSEIMELGFRLKLAENKDLGILFVERGESLGKEKLAALLSLAEKYNQQLIMEEVRRGEESLKIEFIN